MSITRLIEYKHKSKILALPTSMKLFNPSIVKNNDGWIALVRVVEEDKNKKNRNGYNYSENWLIYLDGNLNILSHEVIDDTRQINTISECSYGLEDGRIFRWKNETWVLFSGLNIINKKFINTMCLARLEGNKLVDFKVIPSPKNLEREKNWTPLIKDNELYFIYNIDPLEIYQFVNQTLKLFFKSTVKKHKFYISGSSTAIHYKNKYIFISHHREKMNVIKKLYLKITDKIKYKKEKVHFYHQFHCLDMNLKELKSSKKFIFELKGIEFCAGLEVKEEDIVISYGLSDQAAKILDFKILDLFKNFEGLELKEKSM